MCDIAPESLQLIQTYRMPVPPLCGDVVARVWLDPEFQVNVCVAVYEMPSTLYEMPDNVWILTEMVAVEKFAYSETAPLIMTVAGLEFPE